MGTVTPNEPPSFRHAATGSGEIASSSTPRFLNALSFCRSTTCCMQPFQPGPMLK
jgi:hypothetical protein